MRFLIFYIIASFSFLNCFSQKKKLDKFNFSNFHEKPLIMPTPKSLLIKYNNIQVLDWRADSTAIGFEDKDYFTTPGICEGINNYLSKEIELKNDSNLITSQLIVCLKKLWITRHLKQKGDNWEGGIVWEVVCFKKTDNKFRYLCRLDTTISKSISRVKDDALLLISLCLQTLTNKINSALNMPDKFDQLVDLKKFMYNFNNVPILLDSKKNKGLYMTYKQFLSNSPLNEQFKIEKEKFTDALYVADSNGKYQLVRNIWGFCDGQDIYIKSDEKYYQLYRVNNTFYLYGSKNIKKNLDNDIRTASIFNLVTNTDTKIARYTISYSPYQLDIINGNIY